MLTCIILLGFPGGANGKEPTCQRRGYLLWVRKILWRREWQPTSVFLPGESPWTEEPGGTEHVCVHAREHTHTHEKVCLWLISNILSYHIDVVMCVHRFRERDGKGRRIFITEKRKAMQDPIKIQGTELLFFQVHHLCLSDIHSLVLSNSFSKILRVSRFQ